MYFEDGLWKRTRRQRVVEDFSVTIQKAGADYFATEKPVITLDLPRSRLAEQMAEEGRRFVAEIVGSWAVITSIKITI